MYLNILLNTCKLNYVILHLVKHQDNKVSWMKKQKIEIAWIFPIVPVFNKWHCDKRQNSLVTATGRQYMSLSNRCRTFYLPTNLPIVFQGSKIGLFWDLKNFIFINNYIIHLHDKLTLHTDFTMSGKTAKILFINDYYWLHW